jgi:hypothetical protein
MGNDSGDVSSVVPMKIQHHSHHPSNSRRPLFPLDLTRQPQDVRLEDTTDADAWIDTDAEGGSEMFGIYCVRFFPLTPRFSDGTFWRDCMFFERARIAFTVNRHDNHFERFTGGFTRAITSRTRPTIETWRFSTEL